MDIKANRKRIWYQFLATLSCMFAFMSAGNIIGWLSPAAVKLTAEDSIIPLDSDQIEWLSSVIYLGTLIGPIMFAFVADTIGRKWINFLAAAIFMVGWVICLMATSVTHLYIARVIHGIGIGITFCVVPIYVGEVTETSIRGAFIAAIMASMSIGFLFIYIIGPFVNFHVLSILSIILPILTTMSFFAMPESPYILIMHGKIRVAEKNLMRLRGEESKFKILEELGDMIDFLEDGFTNETLKKKFKFFQLKKSRFSIAIITALVFTQSFSGIISFMSNFHSIFAMADSPVNNSTAVIIAESVATIIALWSTFYIDRLGRRPTFLISSIGSMVSTLLVGVYYYLDYEHKTDISNSWIAMCGIYGFQIFYHAGLSCLPMVVASEIFPAYMSPWICAYMIMLISIFGFSVLSFYDVIGQNFGYHYSFWMCSVVLIFPTIFLYMYMPETKNKTFVEIQHEIQKKKSPVKSLDNEEAERY